MYKGNSLCNSVNSLNYSKANKGLSFNSESILNNYSNEILTACWNALSINIIQNYQKGKGTFIKGFGTFTYKGYNSNLEGTTNPYTRDKKQRLPIFVVSKEFNEELKPGEYTKQNGIIYYHCKENNNISIPKLNLAEIAYSISLSKDEVSNILKHIFKTMNNSIKKKCFKNKELPGLGIIVNKNNILAVNFFDDFVNENKLQNYRLTFVKKNISLDMDMDNAKNLQIKDLKNVYQSTDELKATNSLYTTCEKSAKNYLNRLYNINVETIPEFEKPNIHKKYTIDENKNDNSIEKKNNAFNTIINKNTTNIFDEEFLKNFLYFKGILIQLSKKYDINKSGIISKEELINVILSAKVTDNMTYDLAKSFIENYNKTDNIDYMKFIARIKKDYLTITSKKTSTNNLTYSLNSDSAKRENIFIGQKSNRRGSQKKNLLSTSTNFRNKNMTINNKTNAPEERCNSENKNILRTSENFFLNRQKQTEESKKKLSTIVGLIPELKREYAIFLDQKISCSEFMNILKKYDVLYPKNKIESLLDFLGIPDSNSFSLNDFFAYVKSCKIIETSIGLDELDKILKTLKDAIYMHGGTKLLFKNNEDSINCKTFISNVKDLVNYSNETLKNVYSYLVKTDRNFTMDDFKTYFENPTNKTIFDEPYYLQMMKTIILKINKEHLKPEEYFDRLLLYNISTNDKTITRLNWVKYLQQYEGINFSAEELDNLFNWIDTKKDNVLDNEEFMVKCNYTLKPLTILQDIININKLDIEDLAHRMQINTNELEKYDYSTFAKKVKKLDYTLPDEFIMKLFDELKKDNKVESKKFLDEINYVKPPENYHSFTQNYINTVKSKISYSDLKKIFEFYDDKSLGTLTKLQYVLSFSGILPEFSDDDHMRFIRITNMFDNNGKVIYPEVLNLIYYFNKSKLSDPFTKLCQTLIDKVKQECNNDIENLMYLIDIGIPKKQSTLNVHKPLTVQQIKKYIDSLNLNVVIPNKIIQKLDIDADGLISYEDLKAVLLRYSDTLYFKYVNDSTSPDINLYSKETMNETKIKIICNKLQNYMKSKNISETGLFRKFDKNNDGFFSNIDFNLGIKEMLNLSPALGDPFFNYLDFYHNGLIDLETFISRLNSFVSTHTMVQNENYIENSIIDSLKEFIIKNKNYSDTEIFQVMDKDCDGIINLDDFDYFVKNTLGMKNKEINKTKLERVMMTLSLCKNLQIGLNDIREFTDLCIGNKSRMNLKEIFKLTANQNLSELKKNTEWTNDIIERLGMFVSEKYDSIEQFFKENSEPGSNKFKFSDFIKFHEKNYELFNNGFNLSKEELLSIYTSLDSQKKSFLTLDDLKNKLRIFNFYTKMHMDVKNFIRENFCNGVDAFKFFIGSNKNTNDDENKINKSSINLKEFFEAFNNFFPKKYANNTIMKYLNKYFKITPTNCKMKNELTNKKDEITFSEFCYIYFDEVVSDDVFMSRKNNDTKLMTNRAEIANKFQKNLSNRTGDNFYYSNLFKKKFEKLTTPFDNNPLLKLKRILASTKYDLNQFFEVAALECQSDNFIVNKHKFKNIIRKLNLGLTNIEIDQIIEEWGKNSYLKDINLKDFIRYLYNENPTIKLAKENISKIIEEIKYLIYKYYSNPIICFQDNDPRNLGKMDFEHFKNIIIEMYNRNEQAVPNFTLIKVAFDTCDLRKDGILDLNEWCKAFASYNGKLDINPEKVSNGLEFYDRGFKTTNNFKIRNNTEHNRKILREWETSGDIFKIYQFLNKNKKLIKKKIQECNFMINNAQEGQFVNPDNLIIVFKSLLPNSKLSQTQWKMIVNTGRSRIFKSLIDINGLFKMIELTCKNLNSHPIPKTKMDNNNNNSSSRKKILSKSINFKNYHNNFNSKNYNGFNNRYTLSQLGYRPKDNEFNFGGRNNTISKYDSYCKTKNIFNPKLCNVSYDNS